jgi:hypothetical protein
MIIFVDCMTAAARGRPPKSPKVVQRLPTGRCAQRGIDRCAILFLRLLKESNGFRKLDVSSWDTVATSGDVDARNQSESPPFLHDAVNFALMANKRSTGAAWLVPDVPAKY